MNSNRSSVFNFSRNEIAVDLMKAQNILTAYVRTLAFHVAIKLYRAAEPLPAEHAIPVRDPGYQPDPFFESPLIT